MQLYSFQFLNQDLGRWANQQLNHLSKSMQNNQAVAIAVFAFANVYLFTSVTFISHVIENWTEIEERRIENAGRLYKQIFIHSIMMGISFVAFNILFSKATKYSLNTLTLTTITITAIITRILQIKNREENKSYQDDEDLYKFDIEDDENFYKFDIENDNKENNSKKN